MLNRDDGTKTVSVIPGCDLHYYAVSVKKLCVKKANSGDDRLDGGFTEEDITTEIKQRTCNLKLSCCHTFDPEISSNQNSFP